tara:strand:+ start:370 stop:783 length:414 start_codon:yes stop_codon:yes gene_type:complete
MGLDRYQVTDAFWNTVSKDPGTGKTTQNTTVYPESFQTDTQREVAQLLRKDFYSSSWFRALEDIRRSEDFMDGLECAYWDFKDSILMERYGADGLDVDSSEAVYKFDLGEYIPKSYFLEIKFNFRDDEIQLGIGQYT